MAQNKEIEEVIETHEEVEDLNEITIEITADINVSSSIREIVYKSTPPQFFEV